MQACPLSHGRGRRILRLRLIVLAAFSAASVPLFFVGGAAGLCTAMPYLITDCTNVRLFIFLRVQRARLTMTLATLTSVLVFILAPIFLVAAYAEDGWGYDENHQPRPCFAAGCLPPSPASPPAPYSPPYDTAPPPSPWPPSGADTEHGNVNIKGAFAATAMDYLGLGILSAMVACAARDLIREAQTLSPPGGDAPVVGVPVVVARGEDGEMPTCAICLDTIQRSQVARQLPCRHTFHRDCIQPWLERRPTCPECRARVE